MVFLFTTGMMLPPEGPSPWVVVVLIQFAVTLLLMVLLRRNRRLRLADRRRALELDAEPASRSKDEADPRIAVESIGDAVIATDGTVDEAVEKSEDRMKGILSAVPVGIGMVKGRRCVWGNQALLTMTGYSEQELVGEDSRIVYADESEYERIGSEGYAAVEREGSVELETRWKSKEGRILEILLGLTAVDPHNLTEGLIFSAMDITERLQMNQSREELLRSREENIALLLSMNEDTEEARSALQDANDLLKVAVERANQLAIEAQAANIAKSEFLANMSHEIRTPMNGIIGLTTLLLDSGLTSDQQELAATVRKSGKSLLFIVNDILDFSKIEAGHMELEVLDFDLSELLKDLSAILGVQASRKKIDLLFNVEPKVPRYLCGDEIRVRQILTNLIGNAIKFTEKGRVALEVKMLKERDTGMDLRFEIHDSGIGMTAEQLEHIFDAFRQVDASISRRYGGTGLGLTICKQLVDMMEGKIGAGSEEGKGSVFWFEISLQKPDRRESQISFDFDGEVPRTASYDEPHAAANGINPPSHKIETMEHAVRVLVVEDNLVNQTVAVRTLQKMGCEAVAASDGNEGMERLKGEFFDVVLMDVQMPGMDGIETTRCLREWEQAEGRPRIPVIAMTAHALSGDRERCLEGGMDGYITKPINIAELSEAILEWTAARG